MLAVVGGLGAALVFATVTLCNSRSSRMIGPSQLLAWVMLIGLVITAPIVSVQGIPDGLDAHAGVWLAVAGVGNVLGLLLAYAALRLGKVGIVAPMVSTQGAIAAVVAVIAGESVGTAAAIVLGFIAVGIFPALIPSRIIGVAAVTLPVALRSGLRMTREAFRWCSCPACARCSASPCSRSEPVTESRSAPCSPRSSERSPSWRRTSCPESALLRCKWQAWR
jgi:uncharacterized membrane protein